MYGFYIKELRIIGSGLEDAVIVLEKGLNVINGPSNTGKSYIFNCINYMFGADSLREIKESNGYEKIFLEIRDFENDTPITLLRFINKKDIFYALTDIKSFSSVERFKLNPDHDASSDNNISKFLLKQIGITENKFLLSNKSGKKKTLGFRSIVNLSMISETKIISDMDSPVFNKIKTDETYCKSVFKFLLTGFDDINCEEIEKEEIRKAKIDSKIEYINNEISKLLNEQMVTQKQLDDISSDKIADINKYSEEILKVEKLIEDKRKVIHEKKLSQNELNLKRNQLSLLIEKFKILRNQYESDLERLTFLQDGEDCLNQIYFNHCPICNSEVDNEIFKEEYSLEVLEASQQEESKIKIHLLELDKTIETTYLETEIIDFAIQTNDLEIDKYKREVDELISKELTPLKNVLTSLLEMSNIKFKLKDIEDRVLSKKGELISFIETRKQKQTQLDYNSSIPKEILKEFTNEIFNTLTDWGYKDLYDITFDIKKQDLIINDQDRKGNGKGYRAFFYAAFSVSLMNYLLSKNHPFTRVLLLDSPITTLKESDLENGIIEDDDMIDISMQDSLFISLSKNSDNKQILIFENKHLPQQVKCNHIAFTKGKSKGRYGFFPIKNDIHLKKEIH
ncbi:hypothetical protein LSG31_13520 [Fodinisporobacter ferrooxydans]|uniref:Rad50/SbcC-type AAA domain-containing protein n=1 Tax=Fodinisporobacter ferrooxydans TaxID=2901836 RepID=A0ABY4CEK5_9BACL|nr:hypothetical protein LSG31_13520 [Alicyclobacillaceae bacterium MYW30-H2]